MILQQENTFLFFVSNEKPSRHFVSINLNKNVSKKFRELHVKYIHRRPIIFCHIHYCGRRNNDNHLTFL